MVADLEAMDKAGIGSVLFLEVGIGVPPGPVAFMSEQWQDNVVHAIKTCERLGMEFILGTGPGWAGSGGSCQLLRFWCCKFRLMGGGGLSNEGGGFYQVQATG